jgi:DNA-directed RNA polymerase subunit RPC12/RpoP
MKKTEFEIREAIESSGSMGQAADKLGLAFSTFKSYAKKLGMYKPIDNVSGKGTYKPKKNLEDVFLGKEHLVTSQLRNRLIREGYKEYKCERCGIDKWNGEKIGLELDHISGIRSDNSLENLRILCPNCHSQTHTFRGRNIANN